MRKFGMILSAMVFQNIAVIIAVGILQSIFGIYGWWYNDRLLLLVNPIYETLLPILLGYTGGRLLGGQRGAVVASIVTYGLTLASSVPIILGALLVGPVTGWIVNKLDKTVKSKIPVGYELLVLNVIAAIIAVLLTSACFLYIGQFLSSGIKWVNDLLENILLSGWLPLTAIIIEPGKVLFFNNVLNYGILGPLGIQQAKELGKSILFLLESNPGPGLGVLLAYMLKTKGKNKKTIKLSAVIHFFGGIHEVYFPFVLLRPVLILALMASGITGILVFQHFNVGLVSLPSPGSIFMFIGLAPPEDLVFILIGIAASVAVSFALSAFLLDEPEVEEIETNNNFNLEKVRKLQDIDSLNKQFKKKLDKKIEKESDDNVLKKRKIQLIVFVCEAGLGSSAMGAAMLRKKLREHGLEMNIANASLEDIPGEADLIICHQRLLKDVQQRTSDKIYYPIDSFTNERNYTGIAENLKMNR